MASGLFSEDRTGGNGMYADGFAGRNILSVTQFNRPQLEMVLEYAQDMTVVCPMFDFVDLLRGKVLTNLFYEPSTRTSSSFAAAMLRLGGQVIQINNVAFSSVSKGESLPDTVRTLAAYTDVIVLRHPNIGAANHAAHALEGFEYQVPIINAGDGTGEHPTQALLDLMTISNEAGEIDGLHVVMIGDLKNGRTVHSLAQLLSLFDRVSFTLVSPDSLCMPHELVAFLTEHNCIVEQTNDLASVIGRADVLYVTRVQGERFDDPLEYERLKLRYVIDEELMKKARGDMVLMHPFPRVGEIEYTVDSDPRSAYFRQMRNGMYMRMALLLLVLGK